MPTGGDAAEGERMALSLLDGAPADERAAVIDSRYNKNAAGSEDPTAPRIL